MQPSHREEHLRWALAGTRFLPTKTKPFSLAGILPKEEEEGPEHPQRRETWGKHAGDSWQLPSPRPAERVFASLDPLQIPGLSIPSLNGPRKTIGKAQPET